MIETWAEIQARIAQREARVEAEIVRVNGAKAVRLVNTHGRMMLVTPSAQAPGKWQQTWFDERGEPWGHTDFTLRDDAIRDAMGLFTKEHGPPHGNDSYQIVEYLPRS